MVGYPPETYEIMIELIEAGSVLDGCDHSKIIDLLFACIPDLHSLSWSRVLGEGYKLIKKGMPYWSQQGQVGMITTYSKKLTLNFLKL